MLGLMLTEKALARQRGTDVDTSKHNDVELLCENYHRHLMLTLSDIVSLQRLVQSKQEMTAISLDLYCNRMVRMNVHLGIAAVSLGVCTTIAGYLGMNLDIPSSFPSFTATVGGSFALAALIHGLCACYASGYDLRWTARQRAEEMKALQCIFKDMGRIDYILKASSTTQHLSRTHFGQL